jgi:WD40 repeat protein
MQTCLRGHTSGIRLLSFSNDGNYLASATSSYNDTSIRIWPTHPTTRLPQQSDKRLRRQQCRITCLDFSPVDSNILASGHHGATIKLWNVEQEVCIYSFDHSRCGYILSLLFSVEDEGQKCIFVTSNRSLIRTWWNDPSDIESDIVDIPGLGGVKTSAITNCGSLLAAASPGDCSTVTLYDIETMTVVRKLPLSRNMSLSRYNGLAFSPDGKTLVLRCDTNAIHICEVPDLNARRLLQPHSSAHASIGAVAFDPSSQLLASVSGDENVRI